MLPKTVQTFIDAEIASTATDFSDLRAVFLNGTLKRSPETSHTEGLIGISRHIMAGVGVRTDIIRAVDLVIPPGVYPDMREDGWDRDDFPDLYHELIEPADIVVLASPVWLWDQSSMTRPIIERLYGWSGELNAAGQWSYYGKVGGVLITGNEDGGKHCAAQMLGGFNWSSQHLDHGGARWGAARSRSLRRLWARGGSGRRIGRCDRRCVHRVGRSRPVRCKGGSGG